MENYSIINPRIIGLTVLVLIIGVFLEAIFMVLVTYNLP